jgi:hypothetical protein
MCTVAPSWNELHCVSSTLSYREMKVRRRDGSDALEGGAVGASDEKSARLTIFDEARGVEE